MKLPSIPFAEIISHLKSIEETGITNKKTIDRIEQVQDQDHKDYRELERRLAHLEVEFKSISDLISKIPNQTRDRVAEAAAPILEGAQNLTDAINDKEVVQINKPLKKSSVWQKLKNWLKAGWE
mgnify:CR=1 FL=1